MSAEKKSISQEDIMKLLDSCYEKVLSGIPHVSPSVEDMANDYLSRNTPPAAARAMINNQVMKCATSGFITGFGGLDYAETRIIGRRAYKWFMENDFSDDKDTDNSFVIEADDYIEETQEGPIL